jgi:putative oxidoreductase
MIKSFLFGFVDLKSQTTNFALLALRLFAGLSMTFGHGLGKLPPSEGFISGTENLGFPFPIFFAWAAALSEFLGGILLGLGLFTRPAALMICFTMLTAAFLRHADDPFGGKEKALLYLAICIFFMFTGSGKYGLDYLFQQQKPKY